MSIPVSPEAVALHSLLARSEGEACAHAPSVELLKMLYRQMRALAGPRPDLDDLVQMAAEKVLGALPRFEGRSALSTFVYGVAYRTLLGHDRWYRRWSRRFSYADDHGGVDTESDTESTEQAAVRARRAASLHRALAELPPCKRAVIVLHDLEGVEMREIATIVDANERTVRSRLRDGRRKLQEILVNDPLFDQEAP